MAWKAVTATVSTGSVPLLRLVDLVDRHLAELRVALDVDVEPAVLGGLRLGQQQARRAVALAQRLEADGIALQRIVDGERLGILEIAQRHDDRERCPARP